jgi:hypothetical protein
MIHELKTWPEYFKPLLEGTKTFEIRNNDRNFKVGDFLILQEWEPNKKVYTTRSVGAVVNYILESNIDVNYGLDLGIKPGYVVMSITVIQEVTL